MAPPVCGKHGDSSSENSSRSVGHRTWQCHSEQRSNLRALLIIAMSNRTSTIKDNSMPGGVRSGRYIRSTFCPMLSCKSQPLPDSELGRILQFLALPFSALFPVISMHDVRSPPRDTANGSQLSVVLGTCHIICRHMSDTAHRDGVSNNQKVFFMIPILQFSSWPSLTTISWQTLGCALILLCGCLQWILRIQLGLYLATHLSVEHCPFLSEYSGMIVQQTSNR